MLVLGGVAASGAFACTPGGTVTVQGSNMVVAGTTVRVDATGFVLDAPGTAADKTHSPVKFSWNSVNGVVLGTSTTPVNVLLASGSSRPTWSMDLTIPANATASDGFYAIVASQTKANGDLYVTGSTQVWVNAPSAVVPSATVVAPSTPEATPASITPTAAIVPAATAPSRQGPVAQPAPAVAPVIPAASAAAPSASGVVEDGVDPTKPIPVPKSADIWSGLDTTAPTILDTTASTAGDRGTSPGVALVGFGVLGLAGAALVAHQTRRVAVKTSR